MELLLEIVKKVKNGIAIICASAMLLGSMSGCGFLTSTDVASYPLVAALTRQEVIDYYSKAKEYDTVITRSAKPKVNLYETFDITNDKILLRIGDAVANTNTLLQYNTYTADSEHERYLPKTMFNYVKAALNDKALTTTDNALLIDIKAEEEKKKADDEAKNNGVNNAENAADTTLDNTADSNIEPFGTENTESDLTNEGNNTSEEDKEETESGRTEEEDAKVLADYKRYMDSGLMTIKSALGYYFVDVNYTIKPATLGTFKEEVSLIGINGAFKNTDKSSINETFMITATDQMNDYFRSTSSDKRAFWTGSLFTVDFGKNAEQYGAEVEEEFREEAEADKANADKNKDANAGNKETTDTNNDTTTDNDTNQLNDTNNTTEGGTEDVDISGGEDIETLNPSTSNIIGDEEEIDETEDTDVVEETVTSDEVATDTDTVETTDAPSDVTTTVGTENTEGDYTVYGSLPDPLKDSEDDADKNIYESRQLGFSLDEFNSVVGYGKDRACVPDISIVYNIPKEEEFSISGLGILGLGNSGLSDLGYDYSSMTGTCTIRFVYKEDINNPTVLTLSNLYFVNYDIKMPRFNESGVKIGEAYDTTSELTNNIRNGSSDTEENNEELVENTDGTADDNIAADPMSTVEAGTYEEVIIPAFVVSEFEQLIERADRSMINCDVTALVSGNIFSDIGIGVLRGYEEQYGRALRQISTLRSIVERDIANNTYLVTVETYRVEGDRTADKYATYKDTVLCSIEQQNDKFVITDYIITSRTLVTEPDVDPDAATLKRLVSLGLTDEVSAETRADIEKLVSELWLACENRYLEAYTIQEGDTAVTHRGIYDCFDSDVTLLTSTKRTKLQNEITSLCTKYGANVKNVTDGRVVEYIGGSENQVEFITEEYYLYAGRDDGVYQRVYYLASKMGNEWVIDERKVLVDVQDATKQYLENIFSGSSTPSDSAEAGE